MYSYVTRMYSCVTRMLLVCTRMLLVCTCVYSYVTRMYSYVTRMLLVCSFSHDPAIKVSTELQIIVREKKVFGRIWSEGLMLSTTNTKEHIFSNFKRF